MGAKKLQSGAKFESPLPHTRKPAHIAGFRFLTANSANSVPSKFVHYRPPRVVKTKTRWYVEYYYRVPQELRLQYGDREWERFRVFEDINRYKDDEYAGKLRDAVERSLERGWSPFEQKEIDLALEGETVDKDKVTIKDALEHFMTEWRKKGLEPETVTRYDAVCELLAEYFRDRKLLQQPVNRVRKHHIEGMLHHYRQEKDWSNRQYNNMKGYIGTIFSFLKKKEVIEKNPTLEIEKLKTKTKKHKYYDKKLFPKVTAIIKENDPQLWLATQFVYYLAARSSKELRQLKVGSILDGGERFLFPAETAKSKRDDLIPIAEPLKQELIARRIMDYPQNYYIFSVDGTPGPKPVNADYFSDHFRRIRKKAGLSEDHTLYSFKHTRAIHLIKDGAKLADISKLFRHNDIATTAKYARELGFDFDATELNKLSRTI